jgi:hypothetical protein
MKKLWFIFLGLYLVSCTEEALFINQNCLEFVSEENAEYCDDESLDEDKYCEVRYAGQFSLTEQSKNFLPLYCLEVGQTINYQNESGELMEFIVLDKGYYKGHRIVSQGTACDDFPGKALLDCIDHDRAFIRIKSESKTLELELVTLPDTKDKTLGNVGDFLNVFREEVPNYFVKEWSMVVDQRSLSYENENCLQTFESMDLNGQTFHDVITFDPAQNCAHYTYYFNEELGMVGFKRSDGQVWTLK